MKFFSSIFFLIAFSSMTYAADVCVISINTVSLLVQESCNGDSTRSFPFAAGNFEVAMSSKLKAKIDQGYTMSSCGGGHAILAKNNGPTLHCVLVRN